MIDRLTSGEVFMAELRKGLASMELKHYESKEHNITTPE